jgi:hypothetical protein
MPWPGGLFLASNGTIPTNTTSLPQNKPINQNIPIRLWHSRRRTQNQMKSGPELTRPNSCSVNPRVSLPRSPCFFQSIHSAGRNIAHYVATTYMVATYSVQGHLPQNLPPGKQISRGDPSTVPIHYHIRSSPWTFPLFMRDRITTAHLRQPGESIWCKPVFSENMQTQP